MNLPESRKQLLIAESELSRAQLIGDMAALTADVHALTGRARSFGSIASSAAVLAVGLAALRRAKSAPAATNPSWPQTILKGARLISTLWLVFRSRGHHHENKQPDLRAQPQSHPRRAARQRTAHELNQTTGAL